MPKYCLKINFITVQQNLIVLLLLFRLFYVQLFFPQQSKRCQQCWLNTQPKYRVLYDEKKISNSFKKLHFIPSNRLNCTSNCFYYFPIVEKYNCIRSQSVLKIRIIEWQKRVCWAEWRTLFSETFCFFSLRKSLKWNLNEIDHSSLYVYCIRKVSSTKNGVA